LFKRLPEVKSLGLYFNYTPVSVTGMNDLFIGISTMEMLESLTIHCHNLTPKCVDRLAETMKYISRVYTLDFNFADSKIDDTSCEKLFRIIRKYKKMNDLNINLNNTLISDRTMLRIGESVAMFDILEKLSLSFQG